MLKLIIRQSIQKLTGSWWESASLISGFAREAPQKNESPFGDRGVEARRVFGIGIDQHNVGRVVYPLQPGILSAP